MPVPIMGIPDQGREDKNQSGVDYSFLSNYISATPTNKKIVTASNKDASILFDIWRKSEKTNNGEIKVEACGIDSKEILRLKTMGLVAGGSDSVKITDRGKRVITVMALGEVNKFETARQDKPYNEILAGLSKKNKPGYRIPKYAASSSNNIRLSGLDGSQNRTLNDIFDAIAQKDKSAELFKDKTGQSQGNYIIVDFQGIEGKVQVKVICIDEVMVIQKTYTENNETKTETAEVPVRFDYPQTTVDAVCDVIKTLTAEN